ncbi:16S rRNA (cytidine(1402)-2'-O)-methyltransferase [Dissulfurirhabdus thermomarina]|uniref:Ribosomal RNA small subunit methyltransferase I n=1 Tax=Dissulfurirhabdus thermomarina TaxID=1765737 RepID=A0A6N9TNJ9_DISTH|nr:16S rRNA (cytidine(1402)-2'-O)-methyltransferase [Dissulfurirhabdus thermomarina]NDY42729.1 16S rRNA (cytidine(1402)-2'-O)-methyltransferase [Dissulfurirhabdus thermomarina]NMX22564.1 16S rRNA (cytidine(1402)-2'-O)-methyltransferase [Dissulfurirhabdus thermomarina]
MCAASPAKAAPGALWVVGTPIGNLGDITRRAVEALRAADLVVAEDTRRTRRLLAALGLRRPLLSCHEHNEEERIPGILDRLRAGDHVALASDAGTPALADPGRRLVRRALEAGLPVRPVPGVSAVTTLLSVAGLPADTFVFAGFLPPRRPARLAALRDLAGDPRTLVFFEAPHRAPAMLADAVEVLGGQRPATLGRELTKIHETLLAGSLAEIRDAMTRAAPIRGEITLAVAGAPPAGGAAGAETRPGVDRLLAALVEGRRLSVRDAAALVALATGLPRGDTYARALAARNDSGRGAEED